MFTLRVKDKFDAAHQLIGYPGDCANLHGHTWKVEVVLAGNELDDLNMLIDFRRIKDVVKWTISPLDHAYLNDIHALRTDIPTAEYISQYLFETIAHNMSVLGFPEDVTLKEVTVWESDNASITYSKEKDDRDTESK